MSRKYLILAILSIFLLSCGGGTNNGSVTIVFTGDVLLDRGVRPTIEKNGVKDLFKGVSHHFYNADYVVINLECPITDTASPVNKKYIFRADSKCAEGLKQAGVTHCALANNHTMDQGRAGLQSTVRNLKSVGISTVGFGYTREERIVPTYINQNNIHIALFNSCPLRVENWQNLENTPDINQADCSTLAKEIRTFKTQRPDYYVVVILHWGTEFISTPSLTQRYAAAELVSAGADLIIGHHPHVIQPMDTIGKVPVFYSLGNFVFDQSKPEGRKAQMAVVTFSKDSLSAKAVGVEIKGNMPVVKE
ncbi:MAG: CapA family protein [Bacteroidales bacterium]|nr:CapA family protein [Bacteroidales bacterium]